MGSDEGGGFGGADGDEVAPDQGKVGEEFADFGVGEDECEEGAEVADGCTERRGVLLVTAAEDDG